jgi:HEAT repeat protein
MREETFARVHEALSARGLADKRDYVRSLEQRRDEQALALLVECLGDESGYLRELAEAALAKLNEREAAAAGARLLPLLREGLWYARASAARTLGGMAYAPAAASLLGMCEDRVDSVAREAVAALAAIGAHGGATRIAWELHRTSPERRAARLDRLRARDGALADRVQGLLAVDRLMTHPDPDQLRDDAPQVRAWEERTWEDRRAGAESGEEQLAPAGDAASGVDASVR